jgi:hypothetical protein
MTDDTKTSTPVESSTPAPADDATTPGSTSNKTFWTGIGIGSAALVAALMYAKRPKRRIR